MIELRLDTLENLDQVSEIKTAANTARLPWIATCRTTSEGGHFAGPDESRLEILLKMDAPFADWELKSFNGSSAARLQENSELILSSHDFSGRPDRLNNLLLEMDESGCDVRKVVWAARSIRDNAEAFEILRDSSKPTVALCMGEAGIISRILARKFGAFLTFASLDQASATAPGQVSIADMKRLYRWDKIRKQTKVYGVVANPVGHSMSPAIHNAAFYATDYDGIYVPLLVNPGYESFKAFMETFVPFDGLDLSGLSVTLPHKENALRYLQEIGGTIEELAARIGAVNTIAIDRSSAKPKLSGFNTDYSAILKSVTIAMGCELADLKGVPVAILGAGGTGRTATAAMAHYGANVTVFNRTQSKAAELATEFGVAAESWEKLGESNCRVYINATSVGMHPRVDETPFGDHPPRLTRDSVVFDTIYNPMKTRLIREAEAAGAKTIGGVEMFVQQAGVQFRLWTEQEAPVNVMRGVIEKRLAS